MVCQIDMGRAIGYRRVSNCQIISAVQLVDDLDQPADARLVKQEWHQRFVAVAIEKQVVNIA